VKKGITLIAVMTLIVEDKIDTYDHWPSTLAEQSRKIEANRFISVNNCLYLEGTKKPEGQTNGKDDSEKQHETNFKTTRET
jgi:hypothetical protein